MKIRLILLLALSMPLPLIAAPAKKAAKAGKVAKKAPVLVWPRISRKMQEEHWSRIWPLQELLNARGAHLKTDGEFGASTEAAVKNFQRKNRLKADGVVGPQTWEKLIVRLKRGDKGQAVKALQRALYDLHGEWVEELKNEQGTFGFETERAVRSYQQKAGLKVDGIVGPQTWCILFNGTVKK